jgi:hypothetical protein
VSAATTGRDYLVAVTIATEVPPQPTGTFTREQIPLALRAVGDVIRNRAESGQFPSTPVEVVLQPKQFSAVCSETYWRRAAAGRWFSEHVDLALAFWQANLPPLAPGALFYYSPISMLPPGSVPGWVTGKTEVTVPGLDRNYFRFYK